MFYDVSIFDFEIISSVTIHGVTDDQVNGRDGAAAAIAKAITGEGIDTADLADVGNWTGITFTA